MAVQRLAFLARVDPTDIRGWSGVPYHMMNELKQRFDHVEGFAPPRIRARSIRTRIARRREQLTGKHIRVGLNRSELQWRAIKVSRRLRALKPDAVFLAGADDIGAFLRVGVPIIHHSDATYAVMRGYYPGFTSLNRHCESLAHTCAYQCIQRAALNIYPSHWAADSALRDYNANRDTLYVIPYGANVDPVPCREESIHTASRDRCRLLLVGADWGRKRGSIAVHVAEELMKRGIDADLSVIGNCPVRHPLVKRYGYLDKGIPAQRNQYVSLWSAAHFFILPTIAECFGMVFAEAAAWGLPVISCATGGVPEAVQNGVTGELLPLDATPSMYADQIERLWRDPKAYAQMQRAARDRYERILNWTAWGDQVELLIRQQLS